MSYRKEIKDLPGSQLLPWQVFDALSRADAEIAGLKQAELLKILRCEMQLADLALDAKRYRYVRAMNPREFEALWMKALCGGEQFDNLIDKGRET